MLIPVRCFTCGAMIADRFDEYQNRLQQLTTESPKDILDDLGVERYCCRRMLLTTVETIQQVIPFYEAMHRRKKEIESEME